MAIGENFYADQPYQDFANLSRLQAQQSLGYGDQAARYADPFMEQRKKEIARLERLQTNPGDITSSPTYQFLRDEEMNAVNASNAARGLRNSGRGLMALQDRAAGVASKYYFPLLQNQTQLAMGGSSPASAGASYALGTSRSQDQSQMAQAARSAGQTQQPVAQTPWWQQPNATSSATTPTSSYGLPYSGISTGGTFGDPRKMSLEQLNAEASMYGLPSMYPQTNNNVRLGANGWDMSNDPFAPSGTASYQTTPAQRFGAEGRYPQVGAFDPYQPYADYTQGGYD